MKTTTYISIDPGANGGIAIWKKDRLEHVIRMPKDLRDLKTYFDYVRENNDDVLVFIEKVQMFMSDSDEENKGKQFRIQKLLQNHSEIIALIVFYGFRYIDVYSQTWQSQLGFKTRGMSSTERKNIYKNYAQEEFPQTQVNLWNADCLCILRFALIKEKYDNNWILERIQNKDNQSLF